MLKQNRTNKKGKEGKTVYLLKKYNHKISIFENSKNLKQNKYSSTNDFWFFVDNFPVFRNQSRLRLHLYCPVDPKLVKYFFE